MTVIDLGKREAGFYDPCAGNNPGGQLFGAQSVKFRSAVVPPVDVPTLDVPVIAPPNMDMLEKLLAKPTKA